MRSRKLCHAVSSTPFFDTCGFTCSSTHAQIRLARLRRRAPPRRSCPAGASMPAAVRFEERRQDLAHRKIAGSAEEHEGEIRVGLHVSPSGVSEKDRSPIKIFLTLNCSLTTIQIKRKCHPGKKSLSQSEDDAFSRGLTFCLHVNGRCADRRFSRTSVALRRAVSVRQPRAFRRRARRAGRSRSAERPAKIKRGDSRCDSDTLIS